MAFTAFTFGDPHPIPIVLASSSSSLHGPAFSGGTNPLPAPVDTIIQSATVSVVYTTTITANGGAPAYVFSLNSGALPTGLSLASSGVISGTPSAAGTFSFVIKVTDSVGAVGTQAFQIIVGTGGGGTGNYGYVS